jgi:predicted DNA-binding transcriptional regulator YafY
MLKETCQYEFSEEYMQINRLFGIVYLLMNKKNTTAKELAAHFEVSVRTIYRDIDTLCEAGIPIYTNKGKGGGICLLENFVLNKSILSEQEQNVILSALQSLQATTYPETNQVLSKLSTLFGNQNPDWIEVDFTYWSNDEESKIKFEQLKDAIIHHHVIQFDYYNSCGQESHRQAEPVKLMFKGQAWYLQGYCRDKQDFRFFKITRIKNLTMEEETFSPQAARLNEETPPSNTQALFSCVLKVDSEMAYRIYDEFPISAITKQEDGSFLIRTQLMAGGWIYGYLMSYEDHVEILEPETLREEVKNKLKNAYSRYQT